MDEDLPRLSTTVTLSLTVPQDAVSGTVTRLSAALSAAVQEAGEDGWLGAASLSLYPVADDEEG